MNAFDYARALAYRGRYLTDFELLKQCAVDVSLQCGCEYAHTFLQSDAFGAMVAYAFGGEALQAGNEHRTAQRGFYKPSDQRRGQRLDCNG